MTPLRFFRNGPMVHVMFWRAEYGVWEWPPGHVDAGSRDVVGCEERTITCINCLLFALRVGMFTR